MDNILACTDPSFFEGYHNYFGPDYLRTRKAAVLSEERTRNEVDNLVSLLGLKGGERILDIGCGWGRHVIELAKRGFKVVGIDQSKTMIERAMRLRDEANIQMDFHVLNMEDIDFSEEFDVVLSLFGSFGYSVSDECDVQILNRIRQSLRSDGQVLIELWNRNRYVAMDKEDVYHEHDGAYILESNCYDPYLGRMNIKRTFLRGGEETIYKLSVRLYTLCEFVKLLKCTELKYVDAYGSLKGDIFNINSHAMAIRALPAH